MKLQFKIDKEYLLVHSLNQNINPFSKWMDFKNHLWELSAQGYSLLSGSAEIFITIKTTKQINKISNKTLQLIKAGLKTKEFKTLYQETERYKKWLEKEWNKNENKIFNIIKELSGLKFPNKTITILVTHPKFFNGRTLSDNSTICWGHPEDWKNYSIVYIAHELMHILTHKNQYSNTMHALIELMTDNELRIRLNKQGKYFREGKFTIGHNYLLSLEKKILTKWKQYIKLKNKNIFQLENDIKKSRSE